MTDPVIVPTEFTCRNCSHVAGLLRSRTLVIQGRARRAFYYRCSDGCRAGGTICFRLNDTGDLVKCTRRGGVFRGNGPVDVIEAAPIAEVTA